LIELSKELVRYNYPNLLPYSMLQVISIFNFCRIYFNVMNMDKYNTNRILTEKYLGMLYSSRPRRLCDGSWGGNIPPISGSCPVQGSGNKYGEPSAPAIPFQLLHLY
jgi:hypothetical protein